MEYKVIYLMSKMINFKFNAKVFHYWRTQTGACRLSTVVRALLYSLYKWLFDYETLLNCLIITIIGGRSTSYDGPSKRILYRE